MTNKPEKPMTMPEAVAIVGMWIAMAIMVVGVYIAAALSR
jgi:hypothetical protein